MQEPLQRIVGYHHPVENNLLFPIRDTLTQTVKKKQKTQLTVAGNAYPHELDHDICLARAVEIL